MTGSPLSFDRVGAQRLVYPFFAESMASRISFTGGRSLYPSRKLRHTTVPSLSMRKTAGQAMSFPGS